MVVLDGMLCHAVGIAVIGVSRVFYPDGMPYVCQEKMHGKGRKWRFP